MNLDLVNATFETVGAVLIWRNVWALYRDKTVAGVVWYAQGWYFVWGVWNCFFYTGLEQNASFWAGLVLTSGSGTWTALAAYYGRKT